MKKRLILTLLVVGLCLFAKGQTGTFPGPPPSPPKPGLHSGFLGQSWLVFSGGPSLVGVPPTRLYPFATYVTIYDEHGRLLEVIGSNQVGQFYAYLKPGDYILLATLPSQRIPPRNMLHYIPPSAASGIPIAAPMLITVEDNRFTPVEFDYSYYIP